jgi:hypothetical protein
MAHICCSCACHACLLALSGPLNQAEPIRSNALENLLLLNQPGDVANQRGVPDADLKLLFNTRNDVVDVERDAGLAKHLLRHVSAAGRLLGDRWRGDACTEQETLCRQAFTRDIERAFAAGVRVYAAHEDASRQISDAWIEERFAAWQAQEQQI